MCHLGCVFIHTRFTLHVQDMKRFDFFRRPLLRQNENTLIFLVASQVFRNLNYMVSAILVVGLQYLQRCCKLDRLSQQLYYELYFGLLLETTMKNPSR